MYTMYTHAYILPGDKKNLQDYVDTFCSLYIFMFEKKKKKEKILKGRNGILKSNDYSNLKNFQKITRGEKV